MSSTSSTPGGIDTALRKSPAVESTQTILSLPARPVLGLPHDIVRWRKWLILLSLLPLLAAFNGRWRIGLDSPIYRGLADSLMRGEGYHFGEFGSRQIYPGFPLLLAGVQKVFGNDIFRPIPQLLTVMGLGLLTLFLTYRLISRHFPPWFAVCAVCGLASNARFIQLTQELLTDVPFMCAMVAAMLGWSWLTSAQTRAQRLWAYALSFVGLLAASTLRPAFWFFAAAWLIVCAWGFFRRSRQIYQAGGIILLAVILVFWAVDPRTRGINPLAGGYEQELLDIVSTSSTLEAESRVLGALQRIQIGVPKLLAQHLPAAILGQELGWYGGIAFSLIVVACVCVFLLPRQPLWGLVILITMVVTPILSTTPRYYVVLVPLILVAILLAVHKLALKLGPRWGDLAILLMLGFVTGMNVSRWIPLLIVQHSVPVTDQSLAFYEHYRSGKFMRYIQASEMVRERIEPGRKVVAPQASVVAYLSGRSVMQERELLPAKKNIRRYPEHLASLGINYVLMPSKFYRDKDPILGKLIDRSVILPRERLGAVAGMRLHRAEVIVPPGDWTKITNIAQYSTAKKVPTTQQIKKKKAAIKAARLAREAAERKAAAERKESAERKLKKAAKERKAAKAAAATQPANKPATQPATTGQVGWLPGIAPFHGPRPEIWVVAGTGSRLICISRTQT